MAALPLCAPSASRVGRWRPQRRAALHLPPGRRVPAGSERPDRCGGRAPRAPGSCPRPHRGRPGRAGRRGAGVDAPLILTPPWAACTGPFEVEIAHPRKQAGFPLARGSLTLGVSHFPAGVPRPPDERLGLLGSEWKRWLDAPFSNPNKHESRFSFFF